MKLKFVKYVLVGLVVLFPSFSFGVSTNTIDFEDYAFFKDHYINGSGGSNLLITDTQDVYEYYDNFTQITNNRQSISFDVSYTGDASDPFGGDWLAFRVFVGNNWQTIWGPANNPNPLLGDIYRTDFTTSDDRDFSVYIDLTPYQGFNIAMGWAYISDIPSNASLVISKIQMNTVDEPNSLVLLGIGLLLLISWLYNCRASVARMERSGIWGDRSYKTRIPRCFMRTAILV